MRLTLNLLLGLLMLAPSLSAQTKELKVKYGKISDEEMNMKSWSRDPAAPAVVLFDKGKITHRYVDGTGFILEFERHVRIKVFSKEATHLGDVAIFYFATQRVNDLKATSYNLENGKVVETKLDKDNVFSEKLTRSRMLKKLTIPAVREGSVIEYKYSIVDEGSVGIQNWVFQRREIPTIWSEFDASVPTFIEYRKMSQGWEPFALTEEELKDETININYTARSSGYVVDSKSVNVKVDYSVNRMHFIQENVPALKPEQYVYSANDYLSQINFDITAVYETELVPSGTSYRLVNRGARERNNSWERLGYEILDDVYKDVIEPGKLTQPETEKCIAGKTTRSEQVAAIYAFIGQNYQKNNLDYIWPSQKLDNLVKNKKGTPTDLNLLFINMLRQAKINAYPLMLSTRENGRIKNYRVTTEALDRTIAAVETEGDKLLLIDVAGWPNPIGLLPETDLNGEGLLLKDIEHIDWMPVQNTIPVRQAVQAELELHPEKGLVGALTFSDNGYPAVSARTAIREKDAQAFVREKFKDLIAEGQCSDLKIEDADKWQEAGLKGTFHLETTAFVTVAGDKIYLHPALGFGIRENPFKNPERKFNIELGTPKSLTLSISFKIPAGYKVEEIPKPAKVTFGENALTFDYMTEVTPEMIKFSIRQNIKKTYIEVAQYADIQQFFGVLVAKMEEQVVLTKG